MGRIIGWGLVAAAAAAIGAHFGTGGRSIGDQWAALDANSLVGLQSFIEQRLDPTPEAPTLYFDLVLPVLNFSLWATVAALSAALAAIAFLVHALGRRRRRRYFASRADRP